MANLKISQLTTYTGNPQDIRWFVMNNSGNTETFKYSGYSSPFSYGQGTGSIVSANLPPSRAVDTRTIVIGNHSQFSTGIDSCVIGGLNNRTSDSYASVFGGSNNRADQNSQVFGGSGNNILGPMNVFGSVNTSTSNGSSAIFGGYGLSYGGGNDNANYMVGGYANIISQNGLMASGIIGGRNNQLYQFDSRDPAIPSPRYNFGVIIAGMSNRVEGLTPTSLGAHVFPIIIGGFQNLITGEESNDSATTGATIVNSINSSITSKAYYSSIINASGSSISGRTHVVMLGTINRTATTNNATFVEDLVICDYTNLNYSGDSAAAAGGVVLGQIYHDNGAMRIRIT